MLHSKKKEGSLYIRGGEGGGKKGLWVLERMGGKGKGGKGNHG